MRVLLLAMPSYQRYFRVHAYPNLGICSVAAHLEQEEVKCLDLRLVEDVPGKVKSLLQDFDPHVVGFSAMSFQYPDAETLAGMIKRLKPSAKTVLGGYHPTTGYPLIVERPAARNFDFFVRGEGELTFSTLVQALRCGDTRYDQIPGLSYWQTGEMIHNPHPATLDLAQVKLPARHTRLMNNFFSRGERADVIETSRGCTNQCRFCSIIRMYGRGYREYDIERVIEDARILRHQGVEKVYISDDNITLNVPRFKRLLLRLIEERIGLKLLVVASAAGIAADEEIPALMSQAGVVQVFIGFEHLEKDKLRYYKGRGGTVAANQRAVELLKKHQLLIIGGFIVGMPDDSRQTMTSMIRQVRELDVDLPTFQCLTPYPGTPVREELLEQGLVVNRDNFTLYDGDHVNVRTKYLTQGQLRRWQYMAYVSLYSDPRTRAGKQLYSKLLPNAPKTLIATLQELVHKLRHRVHEAT